MLVVQRTIDAPTIHVSRGRHSATEMLATDVLKMQNGALELDSNVLETEENVFSRNSCCMMKSQTVTGEKTSVSSRMGKLCSNEQCI